MLLGGVIDAYFIFELGFFNSLIGCELRTGLNSVR